MGSSQSPNWGSPLQVPLEVWLGGTARSALRRSGRLSDGWLDGELIECPLHAARFDVRTGKVLDPPATVDLKTYPVRVVDDASVSIGAVRADAATLGLQAVEAALFPDSAACRRIDLIAYPHGAADARVAVAAREAGYRAGFIGSGVALRRRTDPLLQPRVGPSPRSLGHFALSLARALWARRHA